MADVELNSIGNGDGNNYLLRDNTKIPLSGSNQISGDLIPSTNGTVNLGSNSRKFSYGYITNLFVAYLNGTVDHGVDINFQYGANLILRGKNYTGANEAGDFLLVADDGSNSMPLRGKPSGTLIWGSKNVAMQEDVVPRSGGAVMTGESLYRTADNSGLFIGGGTGQYEGATILLSGARNPYEPNTGAVIIMPCLSHTARCVMFIKPDGTWTWNGTACQITSDQRFKQQISQIDDDLLTAWEDVNLVQFKYNDAVKEKSDNARLHTGYVVQQIDDACKSHGVDVSKYGLYCHEEYAEETREVEHEDGTKTTEVVRPASEHYSLRYTEALIVECAYLRKKNKDLQEQLNALSERLEKLENR